MALPDVVVIQSVEGLNRTQRMTVSQVRQSSSCSTAFKRRSQLFSCLQTQAETSALPGSPVCQTRPETRSTPYFSHASQGFEFGLELALLGLQPANSCCGSRDLSPFIIVQASFLQ